MPTVFTKTAEYVSWIYQNPRIRWIYDKDENDQNKDQIDRTELHLTSSDMAYPEESTGVES